MNTFEIFNISLKDILENYKNTKKIEDSEVSEYKVDLKKEIKVQNLAILLDVSGSTNDPFIRRNQTVLAKEIEVSKKVAAEHISNGNKNIFLFTFQSDAKFVGQIVISESGFVMFPPNIVSGGGTFTDIGLQKIISSINEGKKIQKVILITDGQTNSSEQQLLTEYNILKDKKIQLHIIAVCNLSLDFSKLTAQEESKLPGLDVVNFLSTSAEIYTPQYDTQPYVMATKESDSATHWSLLGVKFSKKIPFPELFTDICKIVEQNHIKITAEDTSMLFIELGMYLALFYVVFPEDLIKNNIQNITCDISLLGELLEFIRYGFELKRQDKPLIKVNIQRQITSWKDRQNSYEDATKLLSLKGSALNQECISFGNGVVCFRDAPDELNLQGNFSTDSEGNIYFAFSEGSSEQATRQALRSYFGTLGIRNYQQSPSVIFCVSSNILLFLLTDHTLFWESFSIRNLRSLARIQAKMLRMCDKGKYGNSFLEDWEKGVIPTLHYTEKKTHLDLWDDYDINPLNIPQPLWWATMMAILGDTYFNANSSIFAVNFADLQIDMNPYALLKYLRETYSNKVSGAIKISSFNRKKSVITMDYFEPTDIVYGVRSHKNFNTGTECNSETHYSKSEREMLSNACMWCHRSLIDADFFLVQNPSPDQLRNDNPPKYLTTPPPDYFTKVTIKQEQRGNRSGVGRGRIPHNSISSSLTPTQIVSPSVPENCHLILLQGTVGAGKTTFALELYQVLKDKKYWVCIEGTDKYCKNGTPIGGALKTITNNLRKVPRKNAVVIIDTCGEHNQGGDVKNIFKVDFTGFTVHRITPNFEPSKIKGYLSWSLFNVMNRTEANSQTLWYLNPVTLSAEKCRDIHTGKARQLFPNDFVYVTKKQSVSKDAIIVDVISNAKEYEQYLKNTPEMSISAQVKKLVDTIPPPI